MKLPEGEVMNFQSGSYAQITIPPYDIKYADYDIDEKFRGDWDHFDMWSLTCKNDTETIRAYSMANYPAEGNIITLNVRIRYASYGPRYAQVAPRLSWYLLVLHLLAEAWGQGPHERSLRGLPHPGYGC